jgi:hypothetical protein
VDHYTVVGAVVIIFLVVLVLFFVLVLYLRCRPRQQLQLDGTPRSCPNPAYDDYTHKDLCPPPQYTSQDRQYQYKFVPTYDSQQINEMLKTPSVGAVEKSTLAPL